MKHTEETKQRIRKKLLGRKLLASTIAKMKGRIPWNKGISTPSNGSLEHYLATHGAWNKGLVGSKSKEKNARWKGGPPKCLDCGNQLANYSAKRCIFCAPKANSGVNHYKWNGGEENPIKVLRGSAEYKAWRLDVFQRDWFTCQMPGCGYKGKDIQAHHIEPVRENESRILERENGITLCFKCHFPTRGKESDYETMFSEIVKSKYLILTFQLP